MLHASVSPANAYQQRHLGQPLHLRTRDVNGSAGADRGAPIA